MDVQLVSYTEFRLLFRANYPKVAFSKPVIDKCKVCLRYKLMSAVEKLVNQQKYNTHTNEKTYARRLKRKNKRDALEPLNAQPKRPPELCVLEFDFQKQLLVPQGFTYSRKLRTRNFTVLDLATNKTTCYLYEETEGAIHLLIIIIRQFVFF